MSDADRLPLKDPLALIHTRVQEKRLFEARFLCHRLGAILPPEEKALLERQINTALSRAEELLRRARAHAVLGRRQEAETLFAQIRELVIDLPDLQKEDQRHFGAEGVIAALRHKETQKKDAAQEKGGLDAPHPFAAEFSPGMPQSSPVPELTASPISALQNQHNPGPEPSLNTVPGAALHTPRTAAVPREKKRKLSPRLLRLTLAASGLLILLALLWLLSRPQTPAHHTPDARPPRQETLSTTQKEPETGRTLKLGTLRVEESLEKQ